MCIREDKRIFNIMKEVAKHGEAAMPPKESSETYRMLGKIAQSLKDELKSRKLSQKDLAGLLNVSPQQVNKYCMGTENMSIDSIVKVNKALGINLFDCLATPQPKPEDITHWRRRDVSKK